MHGITLAQPILLDLAHGNVHVVRTRQIAGGTHESVGIEHVDDARDRHEILFRLLVTLFAFNIAIRALVALDAIVTLVAIIVTVAGTATTLVTLVIIAVTATQATATTIHAVTPIADATATTTREITVFSLVTTFVIITALRGQRGENVIKIAHNVLILRPFHRTTAMARLNVGRIILTMATTIILLRRSIVQSQFGQQIGGSVRITAATALRSLIDAVQGVHRGHDIGRLLARRSLSLLATVSTLGALGTFRLFGALRTLSAISTSGKGLPNGFGRLLFGLLSLVGFAFGSLVGLAGFLSRVRRDLSVCGLGFSRSHRSGRCSGLRSSHGHTGRRFTAGTSGLKRRDKFRLTHGGGATKAHLLGELLELRQFHVFKIRAGCHWFLPFP